MVQLSIPSTTRFPYHFPPPLSLGTCALRIYNKPFVYTHKIFSIGDIATIWRLCFTQNQLWVFYQRLNDHYSCSSLQPLAYRECRTKSNKEEDRHQAGDCVLA